eukprot:TRINITY_DN16996_c0_g1_i1.p1 TRINITY_DN16996_c0_g1~~TRINITY_DN16996_c0_g1_i1.p1  ORF type:complete len:1018 (-),score=164.58 TRINITY_DN16996_c0_g1_i1:856-3909(-)
MKGLFKNWKGRRESLGDSDFDGEAFVSPSSPSNAGSLEANGCDEALNISVVLQRVRAHRRRSMEPSPLEQLVLREGVRPSVDTDDDNPYISSHLRSGRNDIGPVQLESSRPRRRSMEARSSPGDSERVTPGKDCPAMLPTVVDMARGGTASGKLLRTLPDEPYVARKVLSSDFRASENDVSSNVLLKEMMLRRKGDAQVSSMDPLTSMEDGFSCDQIDFVMKPKGSKEPGEQLQPQSPWIGSSSRPLRKKAASLGVWHDLVDSHLHKWDSSTPCTSESESESLFSPPVGRPPRNAVNPMKQTRLPLARKVPSDADSELSSQSRTSYIFPPDSNNSSSCSDASPRPSREMAHRSSSFSQRPSNLQHSSNSNELEAVTPIKVGAMRSRSHGEVGMNIDDDMARILSLKAPSSKMLPQRSRRRSVEMNMEEVAAIVSQGRSRDRRRSVELVSAALADTDGTFLQSSELRRKTTGQSSEALSKGTSPDSILSKNSEFSRRSSFAEEGSPTRGSSPARGADSRKTSSLRNPGAAMGSAAGAVDGSRRQMPQDAGQENADIRKEKHYTEKEAGSGKEALDLLGRYGREFAVDANRLKVEIGENRLKVEIHLQRLKQEQSSQESLSEDLERFLRPQQRQQRSRRRSVEVVRLKEEDKHEEQPAEMNLQNVDLRNEQSRRAERTKAQDTEAAHHSDHSCTHEQPTGGRRIQRRKSVSDMRNPELLSPNILREAPNGSQHASYSSASAEPVLQKPWVDIREKYAVNGSQELGRGKFGVIRVCVSRASGERSACKSISKAKLQRWQDVEDIRTEVLVMEMLRGYPHVVQLQDTFEDADHVHLVMELCEGGELFDRIKAKRRYSEGKAAVLIRTLATVLRNCHALNIMHRDLKPENILLLRRDDDVAIKVIDFGVAVLVRPGHILEDVVGTPNYLAPEVLQGHYSVEGDIWSAGVVLYILLCGAPPFWAINQNDGALELMRSKSLDLSGGVWDSISPPAKNLVRRMLTIDPYMRITADQILGHPWVTS